MLSDLVLLVSLVVFFCWNFCIKMIYLFAVRAAGIVCGGGGVDPDSFDRRGMEGGGVEAKAARMEELSSAAAFVEGGVQDACDDACSICLEAFSDSDPSAVRLPAALQPCSRRWIFNLLGLGCALLGLFNKVALSCFCLAQVTSCKHEFHLQCILEW